MNDLEGIIVLVSKELDATDSGTDKHKRLTEMLKEVILELDRRNTQHEQNKHS